MDVLDKDESPFLCPTVGRVLFSKKDICGFSCFRYPVIAADFYLLYLQRVFLSSVLQSVPYSLIPIISHQKRQSVKEPCFAWL